MGCHALLQGIFPTQGSNPCLFRLLHWQMGGLFTTSATWEALILFCWSIIALQFVSAVKWSESAMSIHISPLPLGPPSHPHPIPPIQVITGHQTGLPALPAASPQLSLRPGGAYMWLVRTHGCFLHSSYSLPPNCAHGSMLCSSFPALQVGSSASLYSRVHTYALI